MPALTRVDCCQFEVHGGSVEREPAARTKSDVWSRPERGQPCPRVSRPRCKDAEQSKERKKGLFGQSCPRSYVTNLMRRPKAPRWGRRYDSKRPRPACLNFARAELSC